MRGTWRLFWGLAGLLVGLSAGWRPGVAAQEGARLWLGEPDVSAFPLVRIPLHTADSHGAPIADLSRLSLRENGIPLAFEVTAVPAGIDIIFVIDANADYASVDDGSGLTRGEKVAESVSQFAGRFMGRDGLDRVSVIVPDEGGEDGRFLIQNAANPDILAQAIAAYSPELLTDTPLDRMMIQAIELAAQREDGRYQAILLFTDGGRIHRQLAFSQLVERAQAVDLPIFAAILGARADPNEVDNVTRLTEPTSAAYVHMPAADGAVPIYLAWQGQANQTQLAYQSLQTKNGRYPITVNLGAARASAELRLELAAPQLTLKLAETEIRRVGRVHDTPLGELQPVLVTVPVVVSWPDGLPRALTAVALHISSVNGQTSIVAETQPDAGGRLALDWDAQFLRAGSYQLIVEAADGLGYTAESEPVIVTIILERPDPPTPTPPPTPVPAPAVPEPPPAIPAERLWLALGLSLLAGLAATFLLWRRWRRRREVLAPGGKGAEEQRRGEEIDLPLADAPLANSSARPAAFLEILGERTQLPLVDESMTIGRDETAVQLVLDDSSVSRLQARIRWRGGRYWLYDEGSAGGTSLNFERLGLAPRPLQDGDQIQIGRSRLHFRLGLPSDEEE